MTKQPKPLKRDTSIVLAAFPEAYDLDLSESRNGDEVVYFAIDDGDGGDGLIGYGRTVREAWADAARRVKASGGDLSACYCINERPEWL